MDIHAPEGPVHSIRDFVVHIAIVTIGIMIALGLDGARETLHEHRLVRETRANFNDELTLGVKHLDDEQPRVAQGQKKLDALLQTMASGKPDSTKITAELESVKNPYYFFATNSWQAALSSGALAHMSTDEVSAYAWSAEGTRIYVGAQSSTLMAQREAIAWWKSHPNVSPEQLPDGLQRVYRWDQEQESLAFLGPQFRRSYEDALKFAGK